MVGTRVKAREKHKVEYMVSNVKNVQLVNKGKQIGKGLTEESVQKLSNKLFVSRPECPS